MLISIYSPGGHFVGGWSKVSFLASKFKIKKIIFFIFWGARMWGGGGGRVGLGDRVSEFLSQRIQI